MSDERIVNSSGNVFADLGLPDADEALAKADLARQIARLIQRQGWTQVRAAQALGIDQPKVSALVRGRLEGFSTERLIHFLNKLDQDVEISVRPKSATTHHAGLRVKIEEDVPSTVATATGTIKPDAAQP
jgi:predicted XRE-type DNA-binding protein